MNQQIEPQRLKQIRKARGLTQDELAWKAALNKQTMPTVPPQSIGDHPTAQGLARHRTAMVLC
jgi:transcriptional regulator with XRE-family HTH domain